MTLTQKLASLQKIHFLSFRFHLISASYLQTPRINFVGRFRADISTINNFDYNYLLSAIGQHSQIFDYYNPQGTGTWAMIDCVVTSVVYTDENSSSKSQIITSPSKDSVIGLPLINNPDRAFAKLVDVDPYQQRSSTIYGMDLGINWDPSKGKSQENAFIGDFVPAVITSDLWERQIVNPDESLHQPMASRSISRLENIKWSSTLTSRVLKRFKEANKSLSIKLSVFNYSRIPTETLFTYGNLVGSIGIAEEGESLSYPENRVMLPLPADDIPLSDDHPCNSTDKWVFTTYFDVKGSRMTVDFGNSFKIDVHGTFCHFYPFYVGIAISTPTVSISGEEKISEVKIIDGIPYMEKDWYKSTAGVSEFTLSEPQKKMIYNNKVLVVILYDISTQKPLSVVVKEPDIYPICHFNSPSLISEVSTTKFCARILLEENPFLVRPNEYQIHRMEMNDEVTVILKARSFGLVPKAMKVKLVDLSYTNANGYLEYNSTVEVDRGIAKFHFIAGNVSNPRNDMRIDGEVFWLGYCSEDCIDKCDRCSESTDFGNLLVFLVWSPVIYRKPYFWDVDVQPILQQYENLYPVMKNLMKLGDYDDVTEPRNVHLLTMSMSLDINHPSYMPVTRDLSPTKRRMILDWLNTPDHPRNWKDVEYKLFKSPDYCNNTVFPIEDATPFENENSRQLCSQVFTEAEARLKKGQYFNYDYAKKVDTKDSLASSDIASHFLKIATRPPLSGTASLPLWAEVHTEGTCSLDALKKNLQTAIELEFCTIPPYLTALYSIKDGYNREVYESIRSVVIQEMLHMAQAANLLISIGGNPRIDGPDVVCSYPTKLPGDVLPELDITLRKATPKHIADVFMMIEFPDMITCASPFYDAELVLKSLTIGKFYKSIKTCMNELNERSGGIEFGNNLNNQLHWPWELEHQHTRLHKIDNIHTANFAIEMIIEQGEGSDQMDPTYLRTNELAHFFKFEELACKHHLKFYNDNSYSFSGKEIEFLLEGVWPMRDNPSSSTIPKGARVYYEAKIFHRMYRSLLRSMQTAFDGKPDAIDDAVYIMESMQIQAKKLMQMEMPNAPEGHPNQTCGPVFDYEWKEFQPLT